MAFRADEAARIGYERAEDYLILRPQDADEHQRARSKEALRDIVTELGPVIDSYPTWHPLVSGGNRKRPELTPSVRCGYKGLDHTVHFANGFVTCPYGDGQEVLDCVNSRPSHHVATITAERLDVQMYAPGATPILVRCEWEKSLSDNGLIPLSIAMPLLLEQEIPRWRGAQVAETWETMRRYFLGSPHGSRSSLFVDQESGQAMKKVWNAIIQTGMYGPIKN